MPEPKTAAVADPRVAVELHQVGAAITRARAVLMHARQADGCWRSWCDLGPAATAQVLVGLRFVDRLDPADAAAAARWLLARQRPDGSFAAHPYAKEGELGATACAWAALHVAGADPSAIQQAHRWVEGHGGLPALAQKVGQGDLSAIFLALAGLCPPEQLPEPNLLFALLPPLEKLIESRFNILAPITLLQTGLLLRHLKGESIGGLSPGGVVAGLEAHRCLELLDQFQNHDGSWLYGDTFHAALCLATLKAIGVQPEEPRFARGLRFLAGQARRDGDGLWYSIFSSDVWPTAFVLRGLLNAGLPRTSPEIVEAARWLARSQIRLVDKPGVGTWSFQSTNQTMPDSDDVGVVLGPLGMSLDASQPDPLPEDVAALVRPAIERGLTWVLGMQNSDGGWPAFQHGLPSKPRGAMMTGAPPVPGDGLLDKLRFLLHPPAELGDPSTEDVTGRVLHGLGQIGYTTIAPEVQAAMNFLRAQQVADGSFWGRWVVNYLAGTALVVRGLCAVGAPLHLDWIQRAIDFLRKRQNEDGGWGEDVASYADPSLAGQGTSTCGLTGLVLSALLESGEHGEIVERAVQYLLREQRPDGSWPNGTLLHALVPPTLFYTLPGTELQMPLEALGLFLRANAGLLDQLPASETEETLHRAMEVHSAGPQIHPRDVRGSWREAGLQDLVSAGDPMADKVIDELVATGETGVVNKLMGTLARMVDPVPAQLPPLTHAYFESSAILPAWADPDKIAQAERLFERCGWGVGAVLFCSSLPQCYAFPEGARVLLYTQGTSRHARRRIIETGQLVFDVASPGGLTAQGRGLRSAQKVRLMHAAIRHLIEQQESWNQSWGVPINQVELVGTLLSFSSVVIEGLRRLGFEVSPDEAEAWMHLWNVVGHVMGIREDLRPRDFADGEALFAVLRGHWGASPEGRELTRATLELMDELLPDHYLDGFPGAMVRHLAGDHCADLLGIPPADWTTLLVRIGTRLAHLFDVTERVADITGLARLASFDLMKALHGWSREGKNVEFRIPEALLRRWDGDGPK